MARLHCVGADGSLVGYDGDYYCEVIEPGYWFQTLTVALGCFVVHFIF